MMENGSELNLALDLTPVIPWMESDFVNARPLTVERVAMLYRIPYWLIEGPEPSWLRRPIWRMRAARWAREDRRLESKYLQEAA